MARARTLTRQAGVRQTHCRDAIFFFQIKANHRLGRSLLSVGKPCEHKQSGPLDFAIFSLHREGLSVTGAAHHPLTAKAQVRFPVSDLEPSFGTPPSYALARVSQRLEYPFRCPLDRDFLDN